MEFIKLYSRHSFLNLFQTAIKAKHIIPPEKAIAAHKRSVLLQPNCSENIARPDPETALPTYVQKLSAPDINEIFPKREKYGGTIQVTIIFTPYIQPVKRAEKITETPAFFPFVTNSKNADTKPKINIIPVRSISFFTIFL